MTLPSDADLVLLLHNPRCSKSRATRALLEERGIAFRERLYLEEPLDFEELEELERRLARPAREWARTKEEAWAGAGLSDSSRSEEILTAMVAEPVLMERPVVIRGVRAALGRPPEAVLELFD